MIRFSTGLRNAHMSNNSYATALYYNTTISFEDGTGTGGADRIADSASGFVTAGYVAGQYISVVGSTSNNITGVKVLAVAAGYLEVAAGTLSTEAAGDPVVIGAGTGGGSIDELLRNGVIELRTGSQPASADDAETGTLLVRITNGAGAFTPGSPTNGLNIGAAASGTSGIESGETWQGLGLAAGTAGWYRHYDNSYTTGASTTAKRYDGLCGVGTNQLRLSTLTVAVDAPITVSTGTFNQPAA